MVAGLKLKLTVTIIAAFLAIAAQWLAVLDIVSHSFSLWFKAGVTPITRSVQALSIVATIALGASLGQLWAYDLLRGERSLWRFLPLALSTAGFGGLLVIGGMLASGLLEAVVRLA